MKFWSLRVQQLSNLATQKLNNSETKKDIKSAHMKLKK